VDELSYILFICVCAPLLLSLFVLDRKARRAMGFILVGMFCCLFVSEVNGLLLNALGIDLLMFTTGVTPITEELVKLIPVIFFALVLSDDTRDLEVVSFSVGIGFAVLENLVLLTQNIGHVSLFWAMVRGFSSGLMHGICTMLGGVCFSLVRKRKKRFFCGVVALLNLSIVYHAIFNCLVQASSKIANYVGFLLPITTYVVILLKYLRKKKTDHA